MHEDTTGEIKLIPEILERRGRFSIASELLFDNPTGVQRVLSHTIITRCEHIFGAGGSWFEYNAISHLFDVIHDGVIAPQYTFEFDSITNQITARRLDPGCCDVGVVGWAVNRVAVDRIAKLPDVTVEIDDVNIFLKRGGSRR